jgi:hypothetical protein
MAKMGCSQCTKFRKEYALFTNADRDYAIFNFFHLWGLIAKNIALSPYYKFWGC